MEKSAIADGVLREGAKFAKEKGNLNIENKPLDSSSPRLSSNIRVHLNVHFFVRFLWHGTDWDECRRWNAARVPNVWQITRRAGDFSGC